MDPVTYRTADDRRTAEVTATTITVFEGGAIVDIFPATEEHHQYPGSVWQVINAAATPEVIELARMVDFIISVTAEATRPALRDMPIGFLTGRFTTDRALTVVTDAYTYHRAQGAAPGRAAGLASARLLRATLAMAGDFLALQVGQAVEAAYNSQHLH